MKRRGMKPGTGLILLGAICVVQAQEQPAKPKADVIFIHGNVYTGVAVMSAFKAIKRAEAIAVRGERIEAVGESAEILKLRGPETQVIDLGGKFVMPGFNDAHTHLSQGGAERLNVNLVGVKSLEQFRDRLRAKVDRAAPGDWILGGGWDENYPCAATGQHHHRKPRSQGRQDRSRLERAAEWHHPRNRTTGHPRRHPRAHA